jgi:hypothetical protein
MAERMTTLDEHSDIARRLLKQLEAFVDEVGRRSSTSHLESVTTDGMYLRGGKLGQKPERFVEDHLIYPVLSTLGHSFRPQPIQYAPKWPKDRGIPDFALTTVSPETAKELDIRLFGEAKTPNKLQYARTEVREYLQKDTDFDAIAILTDGIEWELWVRPRNEPLDDPDDHNPHATASLRDALGAVKARNVENESYSDFDARGLIEEADFSMFTEESVCTILQSRFGIEQ